MKYYKYQIRNLSNVGTEEEPIWHEDFLQKIIPCTEANEEIAKAEAYGEITPYDDGQPEPTPSAAAAPTWDELAAALQEGVDAV